MHVDVSLLIKVLNIIPQVSPLAGGTFVAIDIFEAVNALWLRLNR